MKKFFLIIFILLDGMLIAISGVFLYGRVTGKDILGEWIAQKPPTTRVNPAPSPTVSTTPETTAPPVALVPTAPASGSQRNIGFSYRNSKARKVMIRGDFNGWRAEPMKKDPGGPVWNYTAVLEPGEYAYLFSVDDKPIRDPANRRTKQVGRTLVSAIVVQPPTSPQ